MKNQHFTIFTHRIITAILSGLLIFTCFVLAQERDAFKKNSLELIEEQNKNEELLIENMELNKELQLQNTLLIEKEQVNQDLLIKIDELTLELSLAQDFEPETVLEPLQNTESTENIIPNTTTSSDNNNNIVDTNTDSSLKSLGIYELTAYCSCERCCGQWSGGPTASGVMPTANHTVASNSLPFGTKLNIKGTIYTVEDTGGMADNVIDIYFNSHQEALNFGRQTAEVFVVE